MHETATPRHLALVGTTASGKSALALEVARGLGDVELVSVDSMQVYRGMDVGTAKPTAAERAEIPHHLLDLADPSEDFSVARFQAEAEAAIAGIEARGHRALLVGGTGLYLQAVVDGLRLPGQWPAVRAELEAELEAEGADREPAAVGAMHRRLADADPAAAARIEPGNARRIVRALEVTLGSGRPFSSFGPGLDAYPTAARFRLVGVWLPRAVVDRRIEDRYAAQLDAGFLDEVRTLVVGPDPLSRTAGQALGYRELLAHLAGRTTLDEAVAEAVRRTRAFARRQRSWFRRDPRITWLGASRNPVDLLPALLGDWSPRMKLEKYHGLGNDFLVLLDLDGLHPIDGATARALCDRHTGVGADGLIRVTAGPVMELYNADGGRAEMSGNGIRCLALALVDAGVESGPEITIATDAGPRTVRFDDERTISVDMGTAKVGPGSGQSLLVDMGNPHVVIEVQDPYDVDLGRESLRYGRDVNLEVIAAGPGPDELTMRVWERGVGETLACGTGACAAAVAAHKWGIVGHLVTVHQPGGALRVGLGDYRIVLTGPATWVATVEVR